MKGTFTPIPSDELVVFIDGEREPRTVVGWVTVLEDHDEGSMIYAMRPVWLDDGYPTDHAETYTVVRRDELDRL